MSSVLEDYLGRWEGWGWRGGKRDFGDLEGFKR